MERFLSGQEIVDALRCKAFQLHALVEKGLRPHHPRTGLPLDIILDRSDRTINMLLTAQYRQSEANALLRGFLLVPLRHNSEAQNQPDTPSATDERPLTEKIGRGRKRGLISQKDAAKACGVGLRTFQKWEADKTYPEGYPTRDDPIVFAAWASKVTQRRALEAKAKKMNSPTPTDPSRLEKRSHRSAWDDE